MAIFDHAVKVDGKWYGAGEEVKASPASVTTEDKKVATATDDKKSGSKSKKE